MPSVEAFNPPQFCPACGYALKGLPAVGRCPECGAGYGGEVVLFDEPGIAAWHARWAAAGFAIVAAMQAVVLSDAVSRGKPVLVAAAVLSVVVYGAWAVRRAIGIRSGGSRGQARFGATGFAHRLGPGPAAWERWGERHRLILTPVAPPGDGPPRQHVLRIKTLVTGVWDEEREALRMDFEAGEVEAQQIYEQLAAWRAAAIDGGVRSPV